MCYVLLKINFSYQKIPFIWFCVCVRVHELNCHYYSFCAHCMYKMAPYLDVYIQKVYFQKPAAPWQIENGLSEMYTKSILLAEYSANICVYFKYILLMRYTFCIVFCCSKLLLQKVYIRCILKVYLKYTLSIHSIVYFMYIFDIF